LNPKPLVTDFRRAVSELTEALRQNPSSRLERAGCIQYFEFCFELAWKTLKSLAVFHGLQGAESPRGALRVAFAQSWINDELTWLEMLEARNRMSHTYSSDEALAVFERLPEFLTAFVELDRTLQGLIELA
jgi:nucleotidyltransferase substrate binding protein (TIGR01987 family)